jgi:hypothetical protein
VPTTEKKKYKRIGLDVPQTKEERLDNWPVMLHQSQRRRKNYIIGLYLCTHHKRRRKTRGPAYLDHQKELEN